MPIDAAEKTTVGTGLRLEARLGLRSMFPTTLQILHAAVEWSHV
jgi:hypothetical protein